MPEKSQQPKKQSKLKVSDYEKLGRTLETIFEGGYVNHRRVYRINFIRGIFFGLGTFIGGTVVVALFVWMLALFTEIDFIKEIVERVQNSIE